MSNLETTPPEVDCSGTPDDGVEVIAPREVPLGGPRAMLVKRTLPTRERSMIGAWCFVDHYGPDDVAESGGMRVLPHPHTGLQTVSWLFEGEIEHTDSAGVHAMVHPGELNLMSAGHGISHSEVSTPETTMLHGVQLWVALPDSDRDGRNGFAFHAPEAAPLPGGGGTVRVFLGEVAGSSSPVATATPLLGAELVLDPGATVEIPVDPGFEHGLLLDTGAVVFEGAALDRSDLGYAGPGRQSLTLHNPAEAPARAILLGGEPFGEDLVMWWNFVGRTHEEIEEYREQWEAQSARFGTVAGWTADERIPAPALPNSRLKPRKRRR
ncbi:pirin family protein [Gordonia caeni]|uniref:Pirin family protein n=1 Tax=Gordonia caeni TaxID=1007097 RepID=A0ABP7PS19_9ACTN